MAHQTRQALLLDSAWRFHLGDIAAPLPKTHVAAYMANKAGYARGPAKSSFDDSDWRVVNLPHDWAVEGQFDPGNHVDQGFLPRGIGWYRRHFRLEGSDPGRRLSLRFDGVSTHCTVWVNGHLLHRNFCGYTPFTVDITDVARFGDDPNTVAVRVDATQIEGWWYEGAGIYRHVWLIKTAPLHVAEYGTFVCPQRLSDDYWDTRIETTLQNCSDAPASCTLTSSLCDAAGQVIGSMHSDLTVAARSTTTVPQSIPITSPRLWSPAEPNLYALRTEVRLAGALVDDYLTTFGYRTIRFDPDEGFFLNDRHIRIKGTCNHQDHAGVGVAVPDSIHEFRIRRLREMGANAYRCAHNPPAPELLDACDRLGMLVIDENRNFGSSPEHLAQLRAMVLRDRNHPSVILWSICNEEPIQTTPVATNIARAMVHANKQLDPSRPVTAAVSGGLLNDGSMADVLDVMGINYQLDMLDAFHAKHPRLPVVAAETGCTLATRGVYEPGARHFFDSYDTHKAPWGATARDTWRAIRDRKYIAGLFVWTGFDYRGEPSPHQWPCVSSHWGILDTCGFAKDSFYLHKAWFASEPMVHLLPHWNWAGKQGTPIRVMAFTNCDEVELFVNGQSLGRTRVDPIDMAQWHVPYQPGSMKAIAYRNERPVAEAAVETTGDAVAIGLEVHPSFDASTVPADGQFSLPITVFATDAQGRRVPTADHFVSFALDGPASVLGVGNGDPTCHEPDKASARSLFRGLAQVIIQTTTTPGQITLTASSPNLRPAELRLTSAPAVPRPAVAPAQRRHFVSDWRMSPITTDRPDPNQAPSEQDMNTWQRIDPAHGPQDAWLRASGYAIYRATFTPPKIMQTRGGRIIFHQIIGMAEVYIDGSLAASKQERAPDAVDVALAASPAAVTVSVLIHADSSPAGLAGPVELVAK